MKWPWRQPEGSAIVLGKGNVEPPRDSAHSLAIMSVACAVAPFPLMLFSLLPFVGILASLLVPLSVLAALGLAIASCVQAVRERTSVTVPVVALFVSLLWPVLLAAAFVLLRGALADFD